jgi:oligoendopeptidase F
MDEQHDESLEQARWDLAAFFYDSPDDPRIEEDFQKLEGLAAEFERYHRGRLHETLGDALRLYIEITELAGKIIHYFKRSTCLDTSDEKIEAASAMATNRYSALLAEKLTFYELELSKLSEKQITAAAEEDEDVRHHLPYLRKIIAGRPHMLSEETEAVLARCEPYGVDAWLGLYKKRRAKLRVNALGRSLSLGATGSAITTEPDADRRAEMQRATNDALAEDFFSEVAADALYVVAGSKRASDEDRGYPHPMSWRNLDNGFTDACTEALHEAVIAEGPELCRRFYNLKAAMLGLPAPLRWSDRNAELTCIGEDKRVTYAESLQEVLDSLGDFCPEWREIIARAQAEGRIDARQTPNREGGARNSSFCLPGRRPTSFTFMTHEGTDQCTETLQHESGHMIQGYYAGLAQGTLQMNQPLGIAEVASNFCEVILSEYRLRKTLGRDDRKVLKLLFQGIDGSMSSVIRQISFSLFERELHGHDGKNLKRVELQKRSPKQLAEMFARATAACYGPDGFALSHAHSDYTWAAIPHLYRPFYVPAYSADVLLATAIMSKKDHFGRDFAPMVTAMFAKAGTETLAELMAPFGLYPEGLEFWRDTIRTCLGGKMDEAEAAAKRLGYAIP